MHLSTASCPACVSVRVCYSVSCSVFAAYAHLSCIQMCTSQQCRTLCCSACCSVCVAVCIAYTHLQEE